MIGTWEASAKGIADIKLNELEQEIHKLKVFATDAAGNKGEAAVVIHII